jgi:FimV-like protein
LEIQLDEVNQLIALEDPTLAVLQQGLGNTLSATPSIADSTANGSSADVSSGPALVGQSEVDGESSDNASATPLLIVSEESWFDRIMGYMPEIDFQSTTTLGVIGTTPSIADSTTNGSSADVSSDRVLVGQSGVGGESSDNANVTPLLIISEQSWFDRIMGYMPEIDFQTSTTTLGVIGAAPSIADSTTNGPSADVSSGRALVGQSEVDGESSDNASVTPLLIVSEESWFDRIMGYMPEIDFQSTTTLGVIGATIVALFTLLFLRRRRAQEELEYSMLSMALKGTHSQFDELKADLDANSSASNLVTDGSHKSASTSKLDLREPPKFSYASSGSPIRLDDSLSSDGPAFDEQVSNTQTSDISSINVPSEALSNSVPTASDSKFNVNLTDSPDHYPEILTSDATAVGALSELSDLMISENASDAGSIQALDSEDLQTQLDLAKVFVELGDGEGAGQILKDVMEHGNSKQKKDASEILSELNA